VLRMVGCAMVYSVCALRLPEHARWEHTALRAHTACAAVTKKTAGRVRAHEH
jgi:hypothetical protein